MFSMAKNNIQSGQTLFSFLKKNKKKPLTLNNQIASEENIPQNQRPELTPKKVSFVEPKPESARSFIDMITPLPKRTSTQLPEEQTSRSMLKSKTLRNETNLTTWMEKGQAIQQKALRIGEQLKMQSENMKKQSIRIKLYNLEQTLKEFNFENGQELVLKAQQIREQRDGLMKENKQLLDELASVDEESTELQQLQSQLQQTQQQINKAKSDHSLQLQQLKISFDAELTKMMNNHTAALTQKQALIQQLQKSLSQRKGDGLEVSGLRQDVQLYELKAKRYQKHNASLVMDMQMINQELEEHWRALKGIKVMAEELKITIFHKYFQNICFNDQLFSY